MAKVDISLVKQLREATGAGFKDCSECLEAANGDIKQATLLLREKGIANAKKISGNSTTEGVTRILIDKNQAVVAELNCQTDFVANNPEFNNLFNRILREIIKHQPQDISSALSLKLDANETLNDVIINTIARVKENITLKRFELISKKDNEIFGSYSHNGGKYSGVVILQGTDKEEVANDMAKQLVSMNPRFIDIEEIDPETLKIEEGLIHKEMEGTNKPAEMVAKIIAGKLQKQLGSLTIVDQAFIKDNSKKVNEYLKQYGGKIIFMKRYELGEVLA